MTGWLAIALALAVGTDVDIIVVRPKTWAPALQAWKSHREQQGYRVLEIEPAATAEATREQIRSAATPNLNMPSISSLPPTLRPMSNAIRKNLRAIVFQRSTSIRKSSSILALNRPSPATIPMRNWNTLANR